MKDDKENMTTESKIKRQVVDALVSGSVPDWAIDEESNVSIRRKGTNFIIRSDLVIVSETEEIPMAVFEIKSGNRTPDCVYKTVRKEVLPLLEEGVRCIAVTEKDGKIIYAQVKKPRWLKPIWRDISNTGKIRRILGDYKHESDIIQSRRQMAFQAMSHFSWRVAAASILAIGVLGSFELRGVEFSWKLYLLVCLIFALIAASHGIVINFEVGDCKISLCNKEGTK